MKDRLSPKHPEITERFIDHALQGPWVEASTVTNAGKSIPKAFEPYVQYIDGRPSIPVRLVNVFGKIK